jgi:hypothetical protein
MALLTPEFQFFTPSTVPLADTQADFFMAA